MMLLARTFAIMALLILLTAHAVGVITRAECARWEKSSPLTVLPMRCVER